PPDNRPAEPASQRGPGHGLATGTDAARRVGQRAGVSEFNEPGVAEFLGQSGQPRELSRGRTNTGAPYSLRGYPAEYTDHPQPNFRRSSRGQRVRARHAPVNRDWNGDRFDGRAAAIAKQPDLH